ncbi:MAG: hypothetical protein DRP41_00800 [Thermodesulfobacteriota bacterium]|nr:MAG: hypothetical protein DRP41_00800 [Thermodesulfobacteriota bacterium]
MVQIILNSYILSSCHWSFKIPPRYEDNICPRCGNKLKSIKIGNRTSFFCSHCQK